MFKVVLLVAGYQRELRYRHTDGSFSAFGNSDDSGSMWLTNFVLKSFAQASPLMSIDQEDLKVTVEWVLQQQQENGCFPQVGYTTSLITSLCMFNFSFILLSCIRRSAVFFTKA